MYKYSTRILAHCFLVFFHFIYLYLFVCISRFLTVLVYIKDTGRNVSISVHQVIIFFFFCLSTFVYIHLLVHSNSVIFKSIGICHTGVNYNIFIHATWRIELDIKILINISTRVQYFASKYWNPYKTLNPGFKLVWLQNIDTRAVFSFAIGEWVRNIMATRYWTPLTGFIFIG